MKGESCKNPDNYGGPFAESGFTGPWGIGGAVDIGFHNDSTLSGVNDFGTSLGTPGWKGALCYYVAISAD
jgi:hypothetical protein